jgi:hypothetical protein
MIDPFTRLVAWLDAYHIPGADALTLHQLYRAMAWLGETLIDQSGATRAPRRRKDLIEKALFALTCGISKPLPVGAGVQLSPFR